MNQFFMKIERKVYMINLDVTGIFCGLSWNDSFSIDYRLI